MQGAVEGGCGKEVVLGIQKKAPKESSGIGKARKGKQAMEVGAAAWEDACMNIL